MSATTDAVDTEYAAYKASLKTKQATYEAANSGRSFQGLHTHATIPADGTAAAPDQLSNKPHYQTEAWDHANFNFTPGATCKHSLTIDVTYNGTAYTWTARTWVYDDGVIKSKSYTYDSAGTETAGSWESVGGFSSYPTIGRTATDTGSDGATMDVSLASAPAAGTLLIALLMSKDGSWTKPAAWSEWGTTGNLAMFYKIADGTETLIEFNDDSGKGDGDLAALLVEILNPASSSTFDDSDESANTATTPSSSVSGECRLALTLGINSTGGVGGYSVAPTGWEMGGANTGGNSGLGLAWKRMFSVSSTGTAAWGASTYTTSRVRTVVVKPNGA